jgi:transposase
LCIDDFATRKGREYRTLIMDAESHLPLEIVPSRDKSDVAEALRKYKHAAIISRDRSSAYAGAITAARPRAKQIADKFHLVKNCGEHVAEQLKSSMDKIRDEVSDIIGTPSSDTAVRYGLYRPPSPHDVEMFTKVHAAVPVSQLFFASPCLGASAPATI